MRKATKITENEMLDALKRSGYMLESELTNALARRGFFVESNQVLEDPVTGKSREIDLLAEYYDYRKELAWSKTSASIKFVFEIKNNSFPMVIMTPFEFSPNIEDWMGLKEIVTEPENISYDSDNYYKGLIDKYKRKIYTQYCSFEKKKSNEELIALHPDIVHSGLQKIVQYCEEMVVSYEDVFKEKDSYFRHLLYMPTLIIKDDLYEFKNDTLKKIEFGILVYNYHFNKEPKMAYIFVITRNGFTSFINSMLKLQIDIRLKMIASINRKNIK